MSTVRSSDQYNARKTAVVFRALFFFIRLMVLVFLSIVASDGNMYNDVRLVWRIHPIVQVSL